MQTNLKMLTVMAMTVFLFSTGCQKDPEAVDTTTELTTHSEDQNQVSAEVDATANDISAVIESNVFLSGREENTLNLCGASASFDTLSNPKKITITYNGANCFGSHTRTGTVVLSFPAGIRWKDAGAAITVSIQNLKVTRLRDNKSITINGTKTITNVSGGLIRHLPSLASITHTITSNNMSITFDNNTQRTWQVAKRRVFTYNNGVVITTTGDHQSGGASGIVEWGTNRFGHAFTSTITQPMVVRQDCHFRLVSGQIKHEGVGTATVTFGLDANGNPTACPGLGHYYFKFVWAGPNGASRTSMHPY